MMKNLTLLFLSLTELAKFSKLISSGYLLNTVNLTFTANIPNKYANLAIEYYNAKLIETTRNVYSYKTLN